MNYNKSEDAANEVVEAIKAKGGYALAVQGDVSKFVETQRVVKATRDASNRLDILVNNAGTTRDNLLALMKEDDWDTILTTDLRSVFNVSKAGLRPMMKQKYRRIVNITSIAGITGNPGQTNYFAAKAGIIGFTKAMAKEYGVRGMAVNAVAPGYVPTDLTNPLPQRVKDALLGLTALHRFGTSEEVADAVVFLASDSDRYITGQVLAVDGGIV